MQSLVRLYDRTLLWSQHPLAVRYLALVSFLDASVFPTPPYFMLAPMALAKPNKAFQYALIATLAAVLGGIVGYLLGMLIFDPVIMPLLKYFHYEEKYLQVSASLQEQGFWAVLIGGFMPIPFKIVAISAGVLRIPVWAFLLGAFLGRAGKFYFIAYVIRLGGENMEQRIRTMISKLGIWMLLIAAGALAFFSLHGCSTYQAPAKVVQASPAIKRPNFQREKHKQVKRNQPSVNQVATKSAKLDLTKEKIERSNQKNKPSGWMWPAQGSIIDTFAKNKKGIEIAGKDGSQVLAANDGEVVYSGNALRGYGNLIIVRHDKNYLTAYAHNRRNLVKEGAKVRRGQPIAEMGRAKNADKAKLHFEIRNQGKPVDPVAILPRR